MRIAVLVIGLVLNIGLFIQALLITSLSNAIDEQNTAAAGAIGLLMAFMWVIACGLVIPVPRVSVVLFTVAGILGFAASGDYSDLAIWGGISFALALMSYFGYRGKRTAQRKETERDELMRQMAMNQATMTALASGSVVDSYATARPLAAPASTPCPRCGAAVPSASNFCGECGMQLAPGGRLQPTFQPAD